MPMPANRKVRSAVEHVFADQRGPMVLVVRTIGIAGARVKIGRCGTEAGEEAATSKSPSIDRGIAANFGITAFSRFISQ